MAVARSSRWQIATRDKLLSGTLDLLDLVVDLVVLAGGAWGRSSSVIRSARGFVVHTLLNRPALFSGYIAASAPLWR